MVPPYCSSLQSASTLSLAAQDQPFVLAQAIHFLIFLLWSWADDGYPSRPSRPSSATRSPSLSTLVSPLFSFSPRGPLSLLVSPANVKLKCPSRTPPSRCGLAPSCCWSTVYTTLTLSDPTGSVPCTKEYVYPHSPPLSVMTQWSRGWKKKKRIGKGKRKKKKSLERRTQSLSGFPALTGPYSVLEAPPCSFHGRAWAWHGILASFFILLLFLFHFPVHHSRTDGYLASGTVFSVNYGHITKLARDGHDTRRDETRRDEPFPCPTEPTCHESAPIKDTTPHCALHTQFARGRRVPDFAATFSIPCLDSLGRYATLLPTYLPACTWHGNHGRRGLDTTGEVRP